MKIRQGSGSFGTVIATVDGNNVRQGSGNFGTVVGTIEGGRMSGAAAAVLLLM